MDSKARLPETEAKDHDQSVTAVPRTHSGGRRRSGGRRTAGTVGGALAVLLMVVWTGCKNPLSVENPNKITEGSVNSPAAYGALVSGAGNGLSRAANAMLGIMETVTDEGFGIGSLDAWRSLDEGSIDDVTNEFVDDAWQRVGTARYMADKAVADGRILQSAGTLPGQDQLTRAYLYAGTIYTLIGDTWQRFVLPDSLTDPVTPGKPIASSNMHIVYDTAISYLRQGLAMAQDANLKADFTGMLARAYQARAIRNQIEPPGSFDASTTSGAVYSDSAGIYAAAVLRLVGSSWVFQLGFDFITLGSAASWNDALGHLQVGPSYVYLSHGNRVIDSVRVQDPIDSIPDPVVQAKVSASPFSDGGRNAPMTEASAREMHLILAENALASADTATFASEINAVRALDNLTAWNPANPQVPAEKMLAHERRVNLLFEGRRLADHYRFGSRDPFWLPNSPTVMNPGELFPIPISEIRSNPNVSG